MNKVEEVNKIFLSDEVGKGLCPDFVTEDLKSMEFQYQIDQSILVNINSLIRTLAVDETFTPTTNSIMVKVEEYKQGYRPLEVSQGSKTWFLSIKDFKYVDGVMHLKITSIVKSSNEESSLVITDLNTGYTDHFIVSPTLKVFVLDTPILSEELRTYLKA